MTIPFGRLPKPRPTQPAISRPVTVQHLHETIIKVLDSHPLSTGDAYLLNPTSAVPVLILDCDERRTTVALDVLAEHLTAAHAPGIPEDLSAALIFWLQHRPVTDAEARDGGVAALDWSDDYEDAVAWRVFVRRDNLTLPWAPSGTANDNDIHRIRSAATGRAHAFTADLHIEGDVALWSASDVPMLSTAVLVNPEQMLADMTASGLVPHDPQVVITPERPVASGAASAIRRLAGETAEPHVMLPWQHVADLGWV